jgi:histidinol dehydrogenase
MIAQAEHDPMAAVVCVAVGDETADQVEAALAEQVPNAERRAIVEQSLGSHGGVLVAQTYDEAAAFANTYAAEHLLLVIGEPEMAMVLARLRNTGTIFLGETSSVAYGDYMTGANHVLPTGGLARSYSGLSTLDFVRWTTWQRVTPRAADRLAHDVGRFADAEGLPGHAAAARAWQKPRNAHLTRHALHSAAKRIRTGTAESGTAESGTAEARTAEARTAETRTAETRTAEMETAAKGHAGSSTQGGSPPTPIIAHDDAPDGTR